MYHRPKHKSVDFKKKHKRKPMNLGVCKDSLDRTQNYKVWGKN